MKRALCLAALFIVAALPGDAQQTLAARLGYAPDARLLIVHADDLGMAHSVNVAFIKAYDTGLVNSGSIMVPCPWFPEIAAFAHKHPAADLGLHLTLTSEWRDYRWRPIVAGAGAATLVDESGYLHRSVTEAAEHIDPKSAELEIRAQIRRARASGIRLTHLDSHMDTLYRTPALLRMFLRVARENRLPVRIARDMAAAKLVAPDDVIIDRIITIGSDVAPENWEHWYTSELRNVKPGVTEIVAHLAYDDEEMRAITANHPQWGAAWRQREYDFLTSDTFRRLLAEHGIVLITWRELAKLVPAPGK